MQRFKLLTVAALLALGLVPVMVDATPQQAALATDQHGDALPAGAVARLGTGRFRHGSTPTFVAFLPGGKEVLSVSDDKTARVWEYPSGKEIRRFGPEETDEPSMPGQRIVFYRGTCTTWPPARSCRLSRRRTTTRTSAAPRASPPSTSPPTACTWP